MTAASATRPAACNWIPKWDHHHILGSVALAAPAVRMVLIVAWADAGRTGHHIHHVVAIQSVIKTEYSRVHEGNGKVPDRSNVPERLEDDGWSIAAMCPNLDVIVIDSESFQLTEASYLVDGVNVASRLAVCPWPAEEDKKRLRKWIALTKQDAIEKATKDGCWQAAAPAPGVN